MKKLVTLAFAAIALLSISCQKDPIGGTAAQAVSGEWYVTVDALDAASGELLAEDPYHMGRIHILTYNTAANESDKIIVDDLGNFWEFKVKVACDQNAMTFGNTAAVDNLDYDCQVLLTNGKITKDGALTAGKTPVDTIEFIVSFDDDDPDIAYKIHGIRYTGFVADE